MRKAAIFLCTLLLPLLVSAASTSDLQQQLQNILAKIQFLKTQLQQPTTTPLAVAAQKTEEAKPTPMCAPSRALKVGDKGADVLLLQKFLINDGYLLSDNATSFFGPATEQGVRDWQAAYKIVSTGSATSTGWGAVGPKTRAAMEKMCAADSNPGSWATNGPPPKPATPAKTSQPLPAATVGQVMTTCSDTPPPTASCANTWLAVKSGTCITSWQCNVSTATNAIVPQNKSPLIERVSGPSSVTAGSSATWSIAASDHEGDALSYSMSWGDSDSAFAQLIAIAKVFVTSSDFSHTYTTPGVYTASATVSDAAGNSVVTPFSVSVFAPAQTISSTPLSSTAPATYWCAVGLIGYWSVTPCANATSSSSSLLTHDLPVDTSATCFYNTASYPYGATITQNGKLLMCAGGGWIPSAGSSLGGQGGYTCTGYGGITYSSEIPCADGVNPNSNASTISCPVGQCLKGAGPSGQSCGTCDSNTAL